MIKTKTVEKPWGCYTDYYRTNSGQQFFDRLPNFLPASNIRDKEVSRGIHSDTKNIFTWH